MSASPFEQFNEPIDQETIARSARQGEAREKPVPAAKRFRRAHPCPICGGYDEARRKSGDRCHGFISADDLLAFCTREEKAGDLVPTGRNQDLYPHALTGPCPCQTPHEPKPIARTSGRAIGVVDTVYPYHDEAGSLLYEEIRYRDPKGFSVRRPGPAASHIYDLNGTRRILYRLFDLYKKGPFERVFIVEGPKDADTLWGTPPHLPAVSNPFGAGKWTDDYAEQLKQAGAKDVVILRDEDTAGREHQQIVAASCHRAGLLVRCVALPEIDDLESGQDITDWLDDLHTVDELQEVVDATPTWTPPVDPLFNPVKGKVRWRKGGELDATPISYLVEDMIPAGWLGAIGGRDNRGKTTLGLEIAKCVLTGEKLFGQFAVRQGKVFAMLLDDPENLIRMRLAEMGIVDHPDLRVATRADVDMTDPASMLAFMAEQLASMGPSFVLIDALYLFVPTGGHMDKANSASAMGPVMTAFDEVANRTKATVAVVAHDNKAGIDIAGSQSIRNALKWIIRLLLPKEFEDDREGGVETAERVLQLNKLKTGKNASWHLRLDGPGQWAFHGTAREYRKTTLADRIVDNLADRGHGTVEEIAKDLKTRNKEVRAACAALLLAGRITRGERPRTDGKPGRSAVTYGPLGTPKSPSAVTRDE